MVQKIWGERAAPKTRSVDKIVDRMAEAKSCEVEVADAPSIGAELTAKMHGRIHFCSAISCMESKNDDQMQSRLAHALRMWRE
jgi:hypothetical protein